VTFTRLDPPAARAHAYSAWRVHSQPALAIEYEPTRWSGHLSAATTRPGRCNLNSDSVRIPASGPPVGSSRLVGLPTAADRRC
jgi:hypothetical protein